jgi:hypothetical protein
MIFTHLCGTLKSSVQYKRIESRVRRKTVCRQQKGQGWQCGWTNDVGGKPRECHSWKSMKGNFPKEEAVVHRGKMPEEVKGDMIEVCTGFQGHEFCSQWRAAI